MKAGDVCSGAQTILAYALNLLASVPAFWFVINCKGYYDQKFSLCSRFGLTVPDYKVLLVSAELVTINKHGLFEISLSQQMFCLTSEYLVFLDNQPLINRKKTEFSAYTKRRKVNGKRVTCHMSYRGKKDQTTKRSMLDQHDIYDRLLVNLPVI